MSDLNVAPAETPGPVVVVRQKGYEAEKKMKRFHAKEVGDGKYKNLVTLEIFELGDDLEVEQKESL